MAATAMPLWGCAAASNPDRRDQTTRAWNESLASIERTAQGRLGVAMLDTGSGLALGWRQDERFAMASTFKLVLAGWMRVCTTLRPMWWRTRPSAACARAMVVA